MIERPRRHLQHLAGALPLAALLLSAAAHAATPAAIQAAEAETAGVLRVERVEGSASLRREGASLPLTAGQTVQQGETLEVATDSRVDLRLGRHGRLEMGPGVLYAERLPFSTWASELETQLRLRAGYLRLVWQPPGKADAWPMMLRFTNWRAPLEAGEYFFQVEREGMVACTALGAMQLLGRDGSQRAVGADACARFTPSRFSGPLAANANLFAAARQERRLAPGAAASVDARVAVDTPPAATPKLSALPMPPLPLPEPAVPAASPSIPTPPVPAPVEPVAPAAAPSAAPTAAPPADAPADAAAAAGAETAAPPKGPEWIVNVLAVTDPSSAAKHVQALAGAGYKATVRQEVVRGRASYRVVVGGLGSQEAADEVVRVVGEKFGYWSAWTLQKR